MNRLIVLLASAAAVTAATAAPAALAQVPADTVDTSLPTQLPRTAVPHHYALTVTPQADRMTFDGHVVIDVEVVQPTNSLVLNAADMTFARANLSGPGGAQCRNGHHRQCRANCNAELRPSAGAGRLQADHRLFRQDQRASQRPVRARLQKPGRRPEARVVHPVRAGRRAPLRAELGRAGLQGHLAGDGDRPRRRHGGEQHAGRKHDQRRRRPQARDLPAHPADVELLAVLRHRRILAHQEDGRQIRHRSRNRHGPRQ